MMKRFLTQNSGDYLLTNNTPIERHVIKGISVWVKREDLSCPEGSPQFSKIRGLHKFLLAHQDKHIGVLDTIHSKAGWGTAWLCKHLGMKCTVFYPKRKGEGKEELGENQQNAKDLGAHLYPLRAMMSAVLWHKANSIMKHVGGLMLPNGLKLSETVEETSKEVIGVPKECMQGTWIISISSGTIAAGVLRGLLKTEEAFHIKIIAHMGYSRSEKKARSYILWMATRHMFCDESTFNLEFVDEGYQYKDKVDIDCPFPCNEYYDLKAWKWLVENINSLQQPILFWNIGK